MSADRPNPLRWLAYAYGSGLPERHREWVLRDTSGSTWLLRHLARLLAQIAPIVILILVLLPGAVWIRIAAVVGGAVMASIFSFAYSVETAEHRVVKAGYPAGTAESIRAARTQREHTEALQRRRAKIAARRARRG